MYLISMIISIQNLLSQRSILLTSAYKTYRTSYFFTIIKLKNNNIKKKYDILSLTIENTKKIIKYIICRCNNKKYSIYIQYIVYLQVH